MIDLVATVKTARSIANAVEGGAIESTFADLGLQAAKDALSKVLYAEDREQPVNSAITHLEGAEAALRTTIQGRRGTRLLYSNLGALEEMIAKRRYILGLMAVCYRYLGERALTEEILSMIPDADLGYDARFNTIKSTYHNTEWDVTGEAIKLANVVSPGFWASFAKDEWRSYAARRAARRAGASKEAVDEAALLASNPYKYDVPSFSRSLTATWRESPRDLLNFREYGL